MASRVVVPLGPAAVDITGVRAGDQNQIDVLVTADGAPFDLTDCIATAQARKHASDVDPAMSAEVEVTDAPGGRLTLRWAGDDVAAVLAGRDTWSGVWDLQCAPSVDDDAVTIAAGRLEAVMDVTR